MDTAWKVLSALPDLRRVGLLAIDTETRDDSMAVEHGSGWPTKQGHICGVSVAYRAENEIRAHYFPIRHPDSENFPAEQVHAWVKDHVAAADLRFVTQNGLYDWGWLGTDGGTPMPPSERIEEIGALATMVDENRYQYGLDALCTWRGLLGKDESLLLEGCAALGLIANKRKKFKPQNYIHQLPARFVGDYAECDSTSTLLLFESLDPVLGRENTRLAYRLECDLLPMVLEMRRRGVRIDMTAAERARDLLLVKRDAVLAEISDKVGTPVSMAELTRNKWLAETFDREGVKYPRTEKGNPSFTGGQRGWMDRHAHWLPPLICKANKYHLAGVNFVETYIIGYAVNGRVHAEIHPHRSENNGTKSFRFSYSDPPLQLMSSRDEELTPLIRGLFLPEEGETWAGCDASQQEFRFAVHYAAAHNVPKTSIALERYRTDPDTDFHAFAAQLTGLDRKHAKNVNFAKIYGAGVRKFAVMIGKSENEVKAIYEQYDRELPFLRALSQIYKSIAARQGYITLYDGARRHFDKWAPAGTWEKGAGPCELEEARRRIADPEHAWFDKGPLWRADVRNALNALIQGSAARHTKLWMRAVWREGIVPLLQMHDALECSVTTREQAEMVAQLGVDAIKLRVPMRIDLKYGRNWGDAKHTWAELHGPVEASPALVPAIPASPIPETVSSSNADVTLVAEPASMPDPSPLADPAMDPPAPPLGPPLPPPPVSPPSPPTLEPTPTAINGAMPIDAMPFVSLRDVIGQPLVHKKLVCPFHDDHKPSCHIYRDHFHCYVCGAHGDAITWLMEAEGYSYPEAIELLETIEPRLHGPDDDGATLRMALKLWDEAQPIAGTLAEYYLTGRHIDVAQLSADVPLRFHPRCIFGVKERHPCLLALLTDIETDVPAGILRTALTTDGRKLGRLSLGRWPTPRAIKLWPRSSLEQTLVVGEGVETVLAAATRMTHERMPLRPAWATVGTGRLATLPPILGLKQLIILTDNDEAGRTAARACGQTAANAGSAVQLLTPTEVKDFNDLVLGSAM